MQKVISSLFYLAAIYDGLLGLAFVFFPLRIFVLYGVEPPNHIGYVQFPALLLILFSLMFWRVATSPARYRDLIPYGVGLKAAYCGLVFWYDFTQGIPAMWIPWAWADLSFLVAFVLAWWRLRGFNESVR